MCYCQCEISIINPQHSLDKGERTFEEVLWANKIKGKEEWQTIRIGCSLTKWSNPFLEI